jgi:hypothetical protein
MSDDGIITANNSLANIHVLDESIRNYCLQQCVSLPKSVGARLTNDSGPSINVNAVFWAPGIKLVEAARNNGVSLKLAAKLIADSNAEDEKALVQRQR